MAAFGIFVALFVCLWVAAFAYWIVALVEVARIPDSQYRAAGTDKIVWVLVVALAGIIGALIWSLAKRRDVIAVRGYLPGPPPGWYPELAGPGLRWWNGASWTEYTLSAPPARP